MKLAVKTAMNGRTTVMTGDSDDMRRGRFPRSRLGRNDTRDTTRIMLDRRLRSSMIDVPCRLTERTCEQLSPDSLLHKDGLNDWDEQHKCEKEMSPS